MAITSLELHEVAVHLHALEGEAASRSAVSRYYYSAFHAAQHWLDQTPGMPSLGGAVGGVHVELQGKLKRLDRWAGVKLKQTGRELAALLGAMKTRRVTADYLLGTAFGKEAVLQQQADANEVLAKCAVNVASAMRH